jgi:hypothetical protein
MGSQTQCTKVFSDFEKIFSVYRAFNSKHFDKKKFSESFYFHGDTLKIRTLVISILFDSEDHCCLCDILLNNQLSIEIFVFILFKSYRF